MDFWIIIDQRHAGPFTLEQLREQQITPERLVWHEGLPDWTPALQVEALAPLFAAPDPVVPSDPCPPLPNEAPQAPFQPEPAATQPAPSAPQPAPASPEFHYGPDPSARQQYNNPPYNNPAAGQPPCGGSQQPPYGGSGPYNPDPRYAPGQQQNIPGQPQFGGIPPCPPTYLVWAVIVTICCCTPAGIVAIIFAANIKGAYYRGDYQKALRNSNRAQAWIIAAVVLGLLYIPLQLVYMGVLDLFNF